MATQQDYFIPTGELPSNVANIWTNINTKFLATTFTASATYNVTKVSLLLSKMGISGNANVSIQSVDGESKPSGTDLTSVTKKDIRSINQYNGGITGGNSAWETFTFDAPALLTSGTTYAVVVKISDYNSLKNYVQWWYEQPSGTATKISYQSTDSGSTWSLISETQDTTCCFEIYSNYAVVDSHITGTGANVLTLGGAYWGNQTFTTTANHLLKSVELNLQKTGADVTLSTINVSIRATSGGEPSGENLTLGTIYGSDVDHTVAGWYEAVFSNPIELADSTMYAIVIGAPGSDYPSFYARGTSTGNVYEGGTQGYSEDSGETWEEQSADTDDLWFKTYGIELDAGEGVSPESDQVTVKKLWAIGSNEFWYEDVNGDLIQLAGSVGELDTSEPLIAQEAYGKVFIANGTNLKIADFANIKITTTNIGSHPPDFGTVLTGGTSNATMVVDYIDALASAVNIYGRRTSNAPFQAETVTGTDNDGNSISFTGTAETRPPHWYDWTVFGNSSTFGEMPNYATLVALYNSRLVLAGNKNYPHQWWMSRAYNPYNFLYDPTDPLTAISGGDGDVGEVGDIITALIPLGNDFFVFGCASEINIIDGDPSYGGTVENLSFTEGIYGAHSWCLDNQNNLYFFNGHSLSMSIGGRNKPVDLSSLHLPNWANDWGLIQDEDRIVLTYDFIRAGIVIFKTNLVTGANKNYFYSLKTKGFYPEIHPRECGIFSSFYYNSNDSNTRALLLGCNDGYIRSFYESSLNDNIGDSDSTIKSWATLPIQPLNKDPDKKGKLTELVFELGGGESGGTFVDTDSLSYEIHVGNSAETVLEDIKDGATAYISNDLTGPGRTNKIRPRARGHYLGIKVYNFNTDETWTLNKITGKVIEAGN